MASTSPCTPASHAALSEPIHLAWDRSPAARGGRIWTRRLGIVEREHSAWGSYLQSVYGSVEFPFDLSKLTWFWWWAPGAHNVTRIEVPVWRRALPGEAWVPGLRMERHLSVAGFFVQHARSLETGEYSTTGASASATTEGLEVMRVSHPSSESTQSSFGPEAASHDQVWYWHAPGSGIQLSVGRSLIVPNRSALVARLAERLSPGSLPFVTKRVRVPHERGIRRCDGCNPSTNEAWYDFDVLWWASQASNGPRLCDVVRRVGFDTVQLTAAFDATRFEIIDCRHTITSKQTNATNAACPPAGSSAHLRGGRRGASVCGCSDVRSFLNCGSCALPAPRVLRTAQLGQEPVVVRPPQTWY